MSRPSWPSIRTAELPATTPPVVTTDGGGGCTTANGKAPFDPVLPLLAALGLAGWYLRRRASRSQ